MIPEVDNFNTPYYHWRINMEAKLKNKIEEMDWVLSNIREALEKIREANEEELED